MFSCGRSLMSVGGLCPLRSASSQILDYSLMNIFPDLLPISMNHLFFSFQLNFNMI